MPCANYAPITEAAQGYARTHPVNVVATTSRAMDLATRSY
jgi:hypothetical protein